MYKVFPYISVFSSHMNKLKRALEWGIKTYLKVSKQKEGNSTMRRHEKVFMPLFFSFLSNQSVKCEVDSLKRKKFSKGIVKLYRHGQL